MKEAMEKKKAEEAKSGSGSDPKPKPAGSSVGSGIGSALREAMEKRKEKEAKESFSAPTTEDAAVHTFEIPSQLTKPQKMMKRGDRIQWFWTSNGHTVIASLITKDSVITEDIGVRHGSRRGEWVIDVIGPQGGALFQMNADQAQAIGELTLSAVFWRMAYLNYMDEYQEVEPETEAKTVEVDGEVIPLYEKD